MEVEHRVLIPVHKLHQHALLGVLDIWRNGRFGFTILEGKLADVLLQLQHVFSREADEHLAADIYRFSAFLLQAEVIKNIQAPGQYLMATVTFHLELQVAFSSLG